MIKQKRLSGSYENLQKGAQLVVSAGSAKGNNEVGVKGQEHSRQRETAHAKSLRLESTWVEATENRLVLVEHSGREEMRHQEKAGTTLYRAFQILAQRVDFLCVPWKPL